MTVTLPVVNGSSGTWGTILNAALTDIDNRLSTAVTTNGNQDNNITNLTSRVTTLESGSSAGGKFTVATSGSRPTPAVGQVVLETDTGFIYYVASVNGTPTRVPMPGSYLAKLKRSTAQNFGNSSAGALVFTAADFDRLGGWNGSTRYTAQVPGMYEFSGAISFSVSTAGYRQVSWYVNAGVFNSSNAIVPGASGDSTVVVARPFIAKLAAGDYVELFGLQNSGATLTTDTSNAYLPSMSVKYLGFYA